MIFEYCASGCSFARLNYLNEKFLTIANDRIEKLRKDLSLKHSDKFVADFSILFNALEEEKFGETFLKLPATKVYADSGGLQMSLYGEAKYGNIEERKERVFKTQAKYSDFGFNFDTIPIEKTEYSHNNKVNLTERVYNDDRILESVCATIRSLKRQVKAFKETPEHDCKIMLIAQGNTLETFKLYSETIWSGRTGNIEELGIFEDYTHQEFIDFGILELSEDSFKINGLTEEEQSYVGGIAVSSACMGAGFLQRFELAYIVGELDIDPRVKKHVHILGAGTANLLLPFLLSPKYFSFIERLSFDSTTHTRKFSFNGAILDEDLKEVIVPKESINYVKHHYKGFWERNKEYFIRAGVESKEELLENCSNHSTKNAKGVWNYINREEEKYNVAGALLPFLVFCDYVDRFFYNLEKVPLMSGPENITHYRMKHPQDDCSFEYYKRMFISKYGLTDSKTITKSEFLKQQASGVDEDEW